VQRKLLGFTIVELLIVIVVIGILAAISAIAYNGIQEQARAATAQSDFANIRKKLELYKVSEGHYPKTNAELIRADLSITKSVYATSPESYSGGYLNVIYCLNPETDKFAFSARTTGKLTTYYMTSDYITRSQQTPKMSSNQTCALIDATSPTWFVRFAITHNTGEWTGDWIKY